MNKHVYFTHGRFLRRLTAMGAALLLFCGSHSLARADDHESVLSVLVAQLAQAASAADASAIDEPVCLDWRTSAHLLRSQGLGVIADASDPATVAAYKQAYRDETVALLRRHGGESPSVESIDFSEVQVGANEEAEQLQVVGSDGSSELLPISDSGSLHVTWSGGSERTNIPLSRVADYWCLNPASP